MRKRIYISADYDQNNGDRDVVDELNKWGSDDLHKIDFVNMASVVSGSVSDEPDCRICELKNEFNKQINASSIVIFIVGDKTKTRKAGEGCERCYKPQSECQCTPYKQNTNGVKACKVSKTYPTVEDIGSINNISYLRHEFEQAKHKGKKIVIIYNSSREEKDWLPPYMKEYIEKKEEEEQLFSYSHEEKDLFVITFYKKYKEKEGRRKIINYSSIKKALGFD